MDSASIRARLERQYVLIHVPPDLDQGGTGPLGSQLDAIEPSTDVVVDMSEVAHCPDDAWQVLSDATGRLKEADGSLTLSRLRPEVRAELRRSDHADRLKVRRRDR
jgi:anti-anti-sigma regulatory factor